MLASTQIYGHYGPGFSDGGLNGVVAFATPDDGAGSDQGITITLSNVPAHATVDVSAMIGFDSGFDPDGWTASLKANGETAGEASEGPAGYGSQHTAQFGGTVASSGPAGGTVTINVAIDGFEGYGWGLNWLQASVFTPTVSISSGGTTVNERDQMVVPITVSRDGGAIAWDEPITVPIEWDGDATRDQDYAGAIDDVVIPAGEDSTTINVAVLDDPNYEPQETFTAKIAGGGQNFVVGSNGPFVTTILESDRVSGVNVEGETYTVGDVKEVKVLVTDEYGYGKAGETVQLTQYETEVIRPQGTTATTDGDGYATFNVQGFGAGLATLVAQVTQSGATQPTTGSAAQQVTPKARLRRYKVANGVGTAASLTEAWINDYKDKNPGETADFVLKLTEKMQAIAAKVVKAVVKVEDSTIEQKVGEEKFKDNSAPTIYAILEELKIAETGVSLEVVPGPAGLGPSGTQKSISFRFKISVTLAAGVLGKAVSVTGNTETISKTIVAKEGTEFGSAE